MKKIVFLEGLPGVGKTTIITELKKRGITVLDEIINPRILVDNANNEEEFLKNEYLKQKELNVDFIVVDRGPISMLSYSQAKAIIDDSYDISKVLEWFKDSRLIFNENVYIYYLTTKGKDYSITTKEQHSPYSSIEKQKLLESISIYTCNKYCQNVKIIEYHKKNMEEVIDEIIS